MECDIDVRLCFSSSVYLDDVVEYSANIVDIVIGTYCLGRFLGLGNVSCIVDVDQLFGTNSYDNGSFLLWWCSEYTLCDDSWCQYVHDLPQKHVDVDDKCDPLFVHCR